MAFQDTLTTAAHERDTAGFAMHRGPISDRSHIPQLHTVNGFNPSHESEPDHYLSIVKSARKHLLPGLCHHVLDFVAHRVFGTETPGPP
jgi:hypothetical protein